MPGIFGFASQTSADHAELLAEMARRMTHHPWYRRETHLTRSGSVGLGRISLGAVQTEPQPAFDEDGTRLGVLAGELFHEAEQRAELTNAGHRFQSDSHAELLLHGYQQEGAAFCRRLDGKFAAAIWDAHGERLVLVNDRFGMKPLYYAHVPGKLLFASEIKALLAEPDVVRERNVRGLAQLFTFGQLLGEDTLLEGIRLLPPGGVLSYDAATDALEVDRYWRLSEWATNETYGRQEWLDRIDGQFARAVTRRVSGEGKLGIALSGGLDARTILALIDHSQVKVKSVSLGVDGSLDHASAAQMARLVGCEHHRYVLNDRFLSRFEEHLRTMVHLTDGHYIDQCIVLPTLPLYRELGIDVLLRGHAGELMHMDKAYNFSLDAAAWTIHTEQQLQGWLYGHLSAYMLDDVAGPLLVGTSRREFEELARESLWECLAESAGVEPQLQRIWQLFVSQRLRRETAASLAMFESVVETRVPFLDAGLTPLLMAAPPELKVGDAIQTYILRRRRPEFLKVVNANTGTRMGAGPLWRKAATFKLRALGKLGVKGYQPYERLGLWLRRELKGLVRDLLLDDRCLDRGVFCPDTVRNVVGAHQDAGRNHTYLLMAMMIYEMGQRQFVDGDAGADENAMAATPSASV
ncbi:MAG TPA: asparagine synthase-related protein [Pirellulales bacterium]|nr:asparagine synthase-related protein [Pirellulales bacterium]